MAKSCLIFNSPELDRLIAGLVEQISVYEGQCLLVWVEKITAILGGEVCITFRFVHYIDAILVEEQANQALTIIRAVGWYRKVQPSGPLNLCNCS